MAETKVDIISGFLGAGKTTLIRKLIKDALAGTKVVLIENEFGEIGIDGGFLKESGIQIREMNSGCICCSLVGDFNASLKQVMATYAPERILIEPSGVGKLDDVMRAIEKTAAEVPGMKLNSAVTVVDCTKAKLYLKNFGEFFTNQIENAGTIVLTRTDKASQEKIDEAVALIREHNKKATIITTPITELDGKEILDTIEGRSDLQAHRSPSSTERRSSTRSRADPICRRRSWGRLWPRTRSTTTITITMSTALTRQTQTETPFIMSTTMTMMTKRSMSIIMITTIMTTKIMVMRSMITTGRVMRTIMIMTTMRMRSLRAGAWRRPTSTPWMR